MDVVVSLGGSIIIPGQDIDVDFLTKFRELVGSFIAGGNRIAIVTGGGYTARHYVNAAKKLAAAPANIDLDWIGIAATKINAELVRTMFGAEAYPEVITNPTAPINTTKKILVGCGWKPDCSSDMDAVLLAENLGINTVINLSNIQYVYDKDPKKFADAQPIHTMSWDDMIAIVGTEWIPSANLPFDPKASQKARELQLRVIIAQGTDLHNFQSILAGESYTGTTIR